MEVRRERLDRWVARHAAARRWDQLVVAGEPRLLVAFEAGVRERGVQLTTIRVPHVLSAASPAEVAATVTPDVLTFRNEGRVTAARQARSAALAGGPGAYGLGDTLGVLEEGRVARLLLDKASRWTGSRAPDGRLPPDGEVPPGVPAEKLVPEPLLAERMVERALAAGAEVTIVDGAAAAVLAPAGVAAVLRW